MRSSEILAAFLATTIATAACAQQAPAPQRAPEPPPRVIASCPPGASFVRIVEGSYNPPAYTNPDVEARDAEGYLRNEWNLLNQDPSYAPPLKAVCAYGGDTTLTAKKTVEVAIPRDVRVCILNKMLFSCFDRRPAPKR